MKPLPDKISTIKKFLRLYVSDEDYKKLKHEADQYGYTLSGLLRIRLLEKVKGLKLVRRPCADMKLLGDILGLLMGLMIEVNKVCHHLERIGGRLNQATLDLFGLDGCLRHLEIVSKKIVKAFHVIEQAITGAKRGGDIP